MARSSDSFFLLRLLKDKTFQAREVKRIIYLSALYLVVTTVLLAVFYQQMLGQLIAGNSPLLFVSEDINLINEQIPALSTVLGKWISFMLLINLVITSIIGVYILRKMGHPILAIKRALRDIGEGKLDTKLRESDNEEFSEITEAFNTALAKINEKIADAKGEIYHLKEQPQPSKENVESALNSCSVILDYFQTNTNKAEEDSKSVT